MAAPMKLPTASGPDSPRAALRSVNVTPSDPPQFEPEVARAMVLAALRELVDAGLGTWSERDDGLTELHMLSGERWLLADDGVTRLA